MISMGTCYLAGARTRALYRPRALTSFLSVEVQAADVALAPSPPSRIVLDVALASGHRLHFTNGVEHSVLVALLRDLSA
jgi:hypothetical protein